MNSFHIATQGILFGLTLSLMVGPAFFSIIQTSISKGFKAGSHLALGVSLSDISMVFIAWFGISSLFASDKAQKLIGIIGGIILIVFGIYTSTKKHISQPKRNIESIGGKLKLKYIAKGFIFNIANPGIWMFWLIPIGLASNYKKSEQIIFLVSILITVFAMDLVKCAISNELKRFMTDNVITIMNRIVGIILVIFGIYLISSSFLPVNLLNNIH
ncbi:MAG TPA: LysE family transporter [Candidatus Onthomorpha intestinigallinarum]|uniref:LysE family transporter n=1 Tax=Candidatus Onthomorpha intestinigallinarum TaxID=2840880 RepID=A0A9D1UHR7_9BACT|nr:LysE family transporter [Candidatus Onthomorpha intestinigallinarum]